MIELFGKQQIEIRTRILAKNISDEHRGDKTPVVMVCVLNGGFMFYTELVKALTTDIECDFVRVKSYVSKNNQGDIKITKDLEIPIKGKHVYLVDDIFDSGNTIKALIEFIKIKNPKSINVVTLAKRKKTEPLENMVWGFEVDEEWLCGMGMDNENGHLRNHPVLYAL
jgi:hypoxanthine phosphoribosyltransferase